MSRTDLAFFIRKGNDALDAVRNYCVNTNESNDYWHVNGQHVNGAISDCAMCVDEGNVRCLSGRELQRRAKRIEFGRQQMTCSHIGHWVSGDTYLLPRVLIDGDMSAVVISDSSRSIWEIAFGRNCTGNGVI